MRDPTEEEKIAAAVAMQCYGEHRWKSGYESGIKAGARDVYASVLFAFGDAYNKDDKPRADHLHAVLGTLKEMFPDSVPRTK